MRLLQAIHKGNIELPLVVVGRKTAYAAEVHRFLEKHPSLQVLFFDTIANTDLPGFYQLADVFVYPSLYEGFGLPVLEALASRIPVVTSRGGCFEEAGGPSTMYVDPADAAEMAGAILQVIRDRGLREKMIETGFQYASGFRPDEVARQVMNVYIKLMQHD